MLNGSELTWEHEMVRTHVDYGSPGGYVLTVAILDEGDGVPERTAVIYIDDTPVGRKASPEMVDAEPAEVLDRELVDKHGLSDLDRLVAEAEKALSTTWQIAVGEHAS